jgi:quercetin dioxygenase-like cupin family protein
MTFDEVPWVPGAHPLERKKGPFDRVVLIEFAPGFCDPAWCHRSHVIYVVSGRLGLELESGTASVGSGQGVSLDAETPHRARNDGDIPVVAFVVSDLDLG